ncbi:MAG: transposase [Clostridiaceae bacterium]
MPRIARIKIADGIYHIIMRGLTDFPIYKKRKEKEKYLNLIKKYQKIFKFKVYGFCIMDTHAHFIIGTNGADLSKFMKGINESYAIFYNNSNERHGPVFRDRFNSLLISEDNYLLNCSIYVHNNPKDIAKYRDKIEYYKYSSLNAYIDSTFNGFCFIPIDTALILNILDDNIEKSRYLYYEMFKKTKAKRKSIKETEHFKEIPEIIEGNYEYTSGKTTLLRDTSPLDVVDYTSKCLDMKTSDIYVKYRRPHSNLRALTVLFLRCLCDLTLYEIGGILGNITTSNVSFLCNKGYKLINEREDYHKLYENFIKNFSTA